MSHADFLVYWRWILAEMDPHSSGTPMFIADASCVPRFSHTCSPLLMQSSLDDALRIAKLPRPHHCVVSWCVVLCPDVPHMDSHSPDDDIIDFVVSSGGSGPRSAVYDIERELLYSKTTADTIRRNLYDACNAGDVLAATAFATEDVYPLTAEMVVKRLSSADAMCLQAVFTSARGAKQLFFYITDTLRSFAIANMPAAVEALYNAALPASKLTIEHVVRMDLDPAVVRRVVCDCGCARPALTTPPISIIACNALCSCMAFIITSIIRLFPSERAGKFKGFVTPVHGVLYGH